MDDQCWFESSTTHSQRHRDLSGERPGLQSRRRKPIAGSSPAGVSYFSGTKHWPIASRVMCRSRER